MLLILTSRHHIYFLDGYIINVFTTFNFQRFYEHGGEMQVAQDAPLRSSMDIFAVG